MGKGPKRPAKGPKPPKDFKKQKHKVGRKLKPAQNDTTVDVKFRQLNMPAQDALESHEHVPTSESNLTLKVCLAGRAGT